MAESILRFENVTVTFDDEIALDNVSFEIPKGEGRVILGAAASGKTVLLKTSLGLVRPDKGRVFLFDEDITCRKDTEIYPLRERCGILFQEGALFDSLTIAENVAYPIENQKGATVKPEEVQPRVEEALKFVELGHTLEKFPSELSGGMRRRVGIARANVTEPELVLYDSPTAGLDPITANNIMTLIVKERDLRKTTTVIVTQRAQDGQIMTGFRYNPSDGTLDPVKGDVEGTKFMVLNKGRLVFEGTQAELMASTDSYVARFAVRN